MYMPSPFYSASVVLFQLHGGMVSHMQALATPSSTVHFSILRENPYEEVDDENDNNNNNYYYE